MMFMTPMPPTSSDSAATPISRVARVLSTDDVVLITDCCVVIVKSVVEPDVTRVPVRQGLLGLLVRRGQPRVDSSP